MAKDFQFNDKALLLSSSSSYLSPYIISPSSTSLTNEKVPQKIKSKLLSCISKTIRRKSEQNISANEKESEQFFSLSDDESAAVETVVKTSIRRESRSKIPMPIASKNTYRKRSEKLFSHVSGILQEKLRPKRVKSERSYGKAPTEIGRCSFCSTPNLIGPSPVKDFESDIHNLTCIIKGLQENETHLTNIVCKYICDKSVEKELLNILTSHAKLQVDAERRAHTLANDMWIQQIEALKLHEKTLQDSLENHIRHNEQLREEMENVKRRNEELLKEKNPVNCLDATTNCAINELRLNNENLRKQVKDMVKQINESRTEYQRQQNKNQALEQSLRTSTSQLHSYKAMLHKIQIEHQLEYTQLHNDLQTNQTIIRECTEASDVLISDMKAVSRQTKSTINWSKYKAKGSSIPDFIHMCRSCINELTKELINTSTQVTLVEKDIACLKEEIRRKEEIYQAAKLEIVHLNERLKKYGDVDVELKNSVSRCEGLKKDISKFENQVEELKQNIEKKKISLQSSYEEIDKIKKIIIEKDEELALSNEKMCEYKNENEALRMQMHGLKQILTASGSGDVARELAVTQEKMAFFQSQYYQLTSEKNYLVEQLQSANLERSSLNKFQNNYYEFINVQQKDLEALNNSNAALKEQLEIEHTQVLELRNEYNKLKEEKNVMRQIYRQLKNEISKVQSLEGEMAGINMEAKRLAIIADFNKQLGEKLQCEVAERDVKITELQQNVQELNTAQIECAKEKVALCVELTEICNINEQLSNSLLAEHKMIETKHKQEDAALSKLKEVEEMQQIERAALRELLNNYNALVVQRDNLLVLQNEYLGQISDLHAAAKEKNRSVEEASTKVLKNEETISQLDRTLHEARKLIDELEEELKNRGSSDKQKQEAINQLKKEKEELESSVLYLQTNVRKLHADLDNCRRSEIEMKQNLNQEVAKRDDINEALTETKICLATAKQEQQMLLHDLTCLKEDYEKIVLEHNELVTNSSYVKDTLEKTVDEVKEMLEESNNEIEHLQDIIAEKEFKCKSLDKVCKDCKRQLKSMNELLQDVENQSRMLSESNFIQSHLRESLSALKQESEEHLNVIANLKQEKSNLQANMKLYKEEIEDNCICYENHIKKVVSKHNTEKKELSQSLSKLTAKLEKLNEHYSNEKAAHSKVLNAQKELADRVLQAVQAVVDEKLLRQKAETHVAELTEKHAQLTQQIEESEETINNLVQDLAEVKLELDKTISCKEAIQNAYARLEEAHKENKSKLEKNSQENVTIEAEVNNRELKIKELKSKLRAAEERAKSLKLELERTHQVNMEYAMQIAKLKQSLTEMEFQKSEHSLRLHETERKLHTESKLNVKLNKIHQQLLSEVLQMSSDGVIKRETSELLVDVIQGRTFPNVTEGCEHLTVTT